METVNQEYGAEPCMLLCASMYECMFQQQLVHMYVHVCIYILENAAVLGE